MFITRDDRLRIRCTPVMPTVAKLASLAIYRRFVGTFVDGIFLTFRRWYHAFDFDELSDSVMAMNLISQATNSF